MSILEDVKTHTSEQLKHLLQGFVAKYDGVPQQDIDPVDHLAAEDPARRVDGPPGAEDGISGSEAGNRLVRAYTVHELTR